MEEVKDCVAVKVCAHLLSCPRISQSFEATGSGSGGGGGGAVQCLHQIQGQPCNLEEERNGVARLKQMSNVNSGSGKPRFRKVKIRRIPTLVAAKEKESFRGRGSKIACLNIMNRVFRTAYKNANVCS